MTQHNPSLGTFQCDATERVAQSVRGLAASWLFNPRRQAHFLLECHPADFLMPNVRAEAGPTAERQRTIIEEDFVRAFMAPSK